MFPTLSANFIWYRVAKVGTRTLHNLMRYSVSDYRYVAPWKCTRRELDIVNNLKREGAYCFALVRNPRDRLVSAWFSKFIDVDGLHERSARIRMNRLAKLNDGPADQILSVDGFEDFVARLPGSQLIETDVHFMNQTLVLADADLHYLGRFERFETEVLGFLKKLGIDCPEKLPWSNRSIDRKAYPSYYSPITQQIVADLYASDIARYGYSFESQLQAR